MKQSIFGISCMVIFLAAQFAAHGQIVEHREYAAEVMKTNLGDAPVQGGIVYVKRCDQCVTEGVSFRKTTEYFQRSARISVSRAMELDGQGATIFFSPKSKFVTRVVFWTRPESQ